ncbi:hypothetical protein BaRGS_00019040, partial [Batillaria attramentaria]
AENRLHLKTVVSTLPRGARAARRSPDVPNKHHERHHQHVDNRPKARHTRDGNSTHGGCFPSSK